MNTACDSRSQQRKFTSEIKCKESTETKKKEKKKETRNIRHNRTDNINIYLRII